MLIEVVTGRGICHLKACLSLSNAAERSDRRKLAVISVQHWQKRISNLDLLSWPQAVKLGPDCDL